MWQCDNCGYTDEDGTTFEEDAGGGVGETVRYCPECGSDEVFMVDEDEDDLYAEEEEEANGEENGEWDEEEAESSSSEEEW